MKPLMIILMAFGLAVTAGEKRAMTFEDMFCMQRLSNLTLAPDGNHALFRVQQADLETNALSSGIFMANLSSNTLKRMTPEGHNCGAPAWHPDGQSFAYTSAGKIYLKALDGSAPRLLAAPEQGAAAPRFSPDGKHVLFVSTVATSEAGDHSGKVLEELLFRQWNSWVNDRRQHVFVVAVDGADGQPRDLTPGDHDSPPLDLGSSHDYTFSPDSREVAFVCNTDEVVAISTNNDIFTINLESGEKTRITTNQGGDAEPHYSPDGRYIAYVSMERPRFEADRHVIWLYDRIKKVNRPLTGQIDHSANGLVWSPDSRVIYYLAQVKGAKSIFRVDLKGNGTRVTTEFVDGDLNITPDGRRLVFTREATHMPKEVFVHDLKTQTARQVTNLNGPVLAQLEMNPWEEFWFKSPHGDDVQGFVVKPPFFEEGRKYPMIYLIHGGPQGMWSNQFHYRWNAQMFAAPGYVAVMVNPHGSKGYGQKFCDAVTRDWGGLPYQDLMKGLEEAITRFAYIDREQMGAAGASYGGYMVNWIAGAAHPFKALVSHNGVFNLSSMAGSTEELWFTEWEFGGSYYEHPELYEKWSPIHRARHFNTPMLVIHSELDYRVPINQGIELFSAHRRQGVPSKWLYFPDEDHFVAKPKNARMWWQTVHGWFDQYVRPEKKDSGS